jgi:tetraacyldisaccharide-1-P 4'-kinase
LGLHISTFKRFLDHHWFSEDDLEAIERQRSDASARFALTTEKDLVRIENPAESVLALSIEVNLENEERLLRRIDEGLTLHESESEGTQGQEHHVG